MDLSRVPEYVMNTLCRICAEKSSKLTPIFRDEALPRKIGTCLPIRVAETDHLPLNVCESCLVKIDKSYRLCETASQSDKRLKQLWKILIKETLSRYPGVVLPEPGQSSDGTDLVPANECGKTACLQDSTNDHTPNTQPSDSGIGTCADQCKTVETASTVENVTEVTENVPEIPDVAVAESRRNRNKSEHFDRTESAAKDGEESSQEMQSTEAKSVYHCQFCSCQLTSPASLSTHESTHSQQKPFLCDTCGKSFKHSNNLKCHLRIHLGMKKKHFCTICNKGFLTNFFLREHMNSHTGETPYKCTVCGKEFRERVHLRQHKWTHSNVTFPCPICGSRFNRKGNMHKHVKKYHGNGQGGKPEKKTEVKAVQSHVCQTCGACFTGENLLKNHMKTHSEQKRFSCVMCGKKFRHSGSLTYHRRTAHTGEKPFQCSYCDQRFSLRSVQFIHERKIHTLEHPYKCSFCSKRFTNSSSLKNHLYVHSKHKLFRCDDCGKEFSRGSNLLVHKKLHTGDRAFACDQCNRTYVQKHDLVKHRKVHDPKSKPFYCKYCGNHFSRKKDSARHATCQYDALRKTNSDVCVAEKILDSVADGFHRLDGAVVAEDFVSQEDNFILDTVEEMAAEKVVQYEDAHLL